MLRDYERKGKKMNSFQRILKQCHLKKERKKENHANKPNPTHDVTSGAKIILHLAYTEEFVYDHRPCL